MVNNLAAVAAIAAAATGEGEEEVPMGDRRWTWLEWKESSLPLLLPKQK